MLGDLQLMGFGRTARGAVLNHDDLEASGDRLGRTTGQGDVRRHSRENNGLNAVSAQDPLEFGSTKRGHAVHTLTDDVAWVDNEVVVDGGVLCASDQPALLLDLSRQHTVDDESLEAGRRCDGAMNH